ncbi:MAG: hypothetical protein ACT6FC_07610 [Methanosarcinaceae archaeon]
MSEGIVIALITVIGSLIGGIFGQKITASATIEAAKIKTKVNQKHEGAVKSPLSVWGVILGVFIGAIITLSILAVFGVLSFGR